MIRKFVSILMGMVIAVGSYSQSSLFLPDDVNYVAVGDLDVPGDQLTVEALIHHTGVSVNVVSKHTDPSNVNYLLRIGSFEITTTDGFANFGGVATAGVTLDPGNTYHIAATYNGQFIRYYVNGCLTGEMAWSGDMIQNDLITAIGQQSSCECEQYRGYIDEVRIWNVARTQQEIADNMLNLPNPGAQAGLLAYYKFDNDLINAQGNAAWDGAPVGAPQFDLIPEPYPQALSATASSSDPLCNGENNAVINGAVSGGYEPYEYSIDGTNFGPASDFDNLPPGGYTFYARPENNGDCISTAPITITDPAPIEANLTTNDVSCFNGDDGSATINPAGGNGPDFEHTWNPDDDPDLTITGLIPGNYSVDIEDACKNYGHELIVNSHFEDGDMGFNSDLTAGGVINFVDGQYAVGNDPSLYNPNFEGTGNGGGGNFMIVNGSSVAGEAVWCQTVNVTPDMDYNFSMWIASLFAASPAELFVEINGVQVGGIAQAPGAANVWEEFTETWNSGTNTQATICIYNQNLEENGNDFGLDDISFKECASCSINFPFVIDEPTELVADITFEEPSCFNGDDASITINANGGTPDYEYSVDGGATFQADNIFDDLTAGSYDVVVRDDNACVMEETITIGEPDELNFESNVTHLLCFEDNSGSIAFDNTSGGTPPYTYSIDGGGTTQADPLFENLPAGDYDLVLIDDNDCEFIETGTITQPDELEIPNPFAEDVSCNGACDGVIDAVAQGGTAPYDYDWENNIGNPDDDQLDDVCAGTYTVTITDQNNCEVSETFTIDEPAPLTFDTEVNDVQCFGAADGSISFNNIQGGTAAFEYSIDNGATFQANDQINDLGVGTYDLVVRDANGCEAVGSATITQPDELTLTVSDDETICENAEATLEATAAGGTAPYNYNWSNGLGNNDQHTVSPNQETTYSVSITDANGCTTDNASITVEFYAEINILVVGPAAPICYGEDALISVFATSGEEPFTYNWTNSSDAGWQGQGGTITYPVTEPTSFTVEATDNCNTTASETVQVEIFDLPEPVFGVTEAAGCYPFTTTLYNTTIDPIAGECIWGFGDGESGFSCDSITHEFSEPGCYDITLMVTSPEGCTNTMTYNNFVCAEEAPDVNFMSTPLSTDITNPQITFINQTEGVNEYRWDFGGYGSSNLINPTFSFPTDRGRSYEVCLEATSSAGCVDTTCQEVLITEEFTLYVPNAFTPDGDGFNDYFGAVVKGYEMTEFQMLIYNRNGELVFESVNPDAMWDGRHRGNDAPQGVYVWKVVVRESNNGEKIERVGHVTLLR